ncbi:MAG: ABC transporter substrate-binding protein, partial [Pseudomonadota bacterium]
MTRRTAARAIAVEKDTALKKGVVWGSWIVGLGALALVAAPAFSAGHETVIESHGITNFGDLKYGPDIAHLPYVNPDAPKGGEISQWASGNYDSFNRFTRKGVAGSMAEMPQESILTSTADDAYGAYCYM